MSSLKSSRSLSHLLMSSCFTVHRHSNVRRHSTVHYHRIGRPCTVHRHSTVRMKLKKIELLTQKSNR